MSTTYAGKTVAIASSTNAAPVQITTLTPHGYPNGAVVSIAGHLVNTRANGEWTIAVIDASNFTLTGTTGNGVGVATGTVTSFVTSVTIPADGDARNAASVNVATEGGADRTQLLYREFKDRMAGRITVAPNQSIVRAVRGTPMARTTDWIPPIAAFTGGGVYWTSVAATKLLAVPVDIPNGAIWTGFTAYLFGAAAPAFPINVFAYKMKLSDGTMTSPFSVTDAPSVTLHATTVGGGTEIIDNTQYAYFLVVISESGGGAGTSNYTGASVAFTLSALDVGAS